MYDIVLYDVWNSVSNICVDITIEQFRTQVLIYCYFLTSIRRNWWKWACEQKRVVVAKAGELDNRPVIFCSEGAFLLSATELRKELDNPNVM
jgi:hypothetical protein